MTTLSMALSGGAVGAGIGLVCGCPERILKYSAMGLVAGAIWGKLRERRADATSTPVSGPVHAVGLECPSDFDLVATDNRIACAYRGKAACLAGSTDEFGQFVCTARDFSCPPGMAPRPGSPPNWCFPTTTAGVRHTAGLDVPACGPDPRQTIRRVSTEWGPFVPWPPHVYEWFACLWRVGYRDYIEEIQSLLSPGLVSIYGHRALTGVIDEDLRDKVRGFQSTFHLPITGEVDSHTAMAMDKAIYMSMTPMTPTQQPMPPSSSPVR